MPAATVEDESGVDKISTDHLEAALIDYSTTLPPFIDDSIPHSTRPGDRLYLWPETESGNWPRPDSPKTFVTCQQWKDGIHKYWTYELDESRYIVKSCGETTELGWIAWNVWHGLEHGFTKKRVLFSKGAVLPKELVSKTGFGSRRSGDTQPSQHYDVNQAYRKSAKDLEKAEKTLKRNLVKRSTKGQLYSFQ